MRAAIPILAVAVALLTGRPACAAVLDDPASTIKAIDQALAKASEFLRAKDIRQAAAALAEAQANYKTLGDSQIPPDLRSQADIVAERLAAAERLIAKADASNAKPTSTIKKKPVTPAQAAKPKKTVKSKRAAKAPAGPSFTADVAPILIARCGNCHVRGSRGGLSMGTFASLEKGSRDGPVISPGASQASRLVEVIARGDMPRGGGRVGPEELAVIARWIDTGALFDGSDRAAPLGQAVAGGVPEGLATATGRESVQFNRDLAPLIVAHCVGCHGGDQPAGQLRLETFAGLLNGGTTGKVLDAGKPAESLILKRLRGIDGDRMPQDKPALADASIAQFETWIKEGAKFDGTDVAQPLKVVVEQLLAGRLSHEELTEKRRAQALKTWQLAAPDEPAEQLQTPNFLLFGNVSTARLAEVAELAEGARTKLVKLLKLEGDAPLVKGSLVLFVFKRSFDYAEFVRMVEVRELPRGASGHTRAKGSDVYACLATPGDVAAALPALVTEQVAGGFLQGLGDVPAWFATGAARAIAARVEPKNPLVKQWDTEVQQLSAAGNADAFMSAAVFDPETTARSYAFARDLTHSLPRLQNLIAAIRDGRDFGQAVEAVYRANARSLVEIWLRRKSPGRG